MISIFGIGLIFLLIVLVAMITNQTLFSKSIKIFNLIISGLVNFLVGSLTVTSFGGVYLSGRITEPTLRTTPVEYYPGMVAIFISVSLLGHYTMKVVSRIVDNYNTVYGKEIESDEVRGGGVLVASLITLFVFSIVATAILPTIADQITSTQRGDLSSTNDTLLAIWPTFIMLLGLIALLVTLSSEDSFRRFALAVENFLKVTKNFLIGIIPLVTLYMIYSIGEPVRGVLITLSWHYYALGIFGFIEVALIGKLTKMVIGKIHDNYKIYTGTKTRQDI